jgi:uncharacterized protein
VALKLPQKNVLLAGSILLIAGAFLLFYHPMSLSTNTKTVTIGNANIMVDVADTEVSREQGLSDRDSLPEGTGMLFVFDAPGHYGFWMKDMNFSLDMIFADSSGHIVTVDSNLSPDTYNHQDPQASKVFYPSSPALYVLEVPAGFAAAHGIQAGEQMSIK